MFRVFRGFDSELDQAEIEPQMNGMNADGEDEKIRGCLRLVWDELLLRYRES